MDRFAFFFSFYGLILGLAVTELVGGLGKLARAGRLNRLGIQSALLAFFVLLLLCATWIDAWVSLRDVSLDFAGLWAPILIAILYYLAATIVFPEEPAKWDSLDEYFARRQRTIGWILLANEFIVNYSYRAVWLGELAHDRHEFWFWYLPYNAAIKLAFAAFIFVKGKRANIASLVVLILLFFLPYWHGPH